MRSFTLTSLLFLGLSMPHCGTVPTPPAPANVPSAPALGTADLQFKYTIAANAEAALFAAGHLPAGPEKAAVEGSLGVIATLAGTAPAEYRTAAMKPVTDALAGRLAEAEAGWKKAQTDAAALNARIADLEAQVQRERTAAAAELTRQLQDARDTARREAELAQRRLVSWIFFGGGFVLGVLAVLTLVYASTVPQLGPRAALGFGIASAGAIGTGTAVLQLMSHPNVVWWGLGLTAVALVFAVAMIYSNQLHHVETLAPQPQPAKP